MHDNATKAVKPKMDNLASWLALHRTPGIGSKYFHELIQRLGSPAAALEHAPKASASELGIGNSAHQALCNPDWPGVELDLAWAAEPDNFIIRFGDIDYPQLLAQIANPPPLLFVRGNLTALDAPQIAMVGSRHPTRNGAEIAHDFAAALAQTGFCVTSGLALGIDAAAHQGALGVGGNTIAVAGTGLDRVYPAKHRNLAHKIAEKGALVSEFPIGTPPKPFHFPQRNRLISGLSVGTVVVEAAVGSGSLITARFAAEQGREIFAIPGSIHNPLARGCHALIREGAKLVETAEHILEELGAMVRFGAESIITSTRAQTPVDPEYRLLIDAMGYEPVPVDLLVERTGLTADAVSSMLLILELQGVINTTTGGSYCLAKNGLAV